MIGRSPSISSVFRMPGGIILVGTYDDGVFRSTDDGLTWSRIWISQRNNAWSFARVDSTLVFLGAYQDGVYRSTDGGKNWTKAGLGSNSALCVLYTSGRVLLTASDSGIFRSTDQGYTWSYFSTGGNVRSIVQAPNGTVFASEFGGILRSTDQGNTWSATNTSGFHQYFETATVDSSGRIFVAAGQSGIIYTTNNGDSWKSYPFFQWTDTEISAFAHPNGSFFAGSFRGVHRSTDGGTSWRQCNYGLGNTNIYFITSDNSNTVFALAQEYGLFRTKNYGQSWDQLADGNAWGLATSPAGDVYVGVSLDINNEIWRTSDGGDHWDKKAWVRHWEIAGLTIGYNGTIYATEWNGEIYKSTDGGATWKRIRSSPGYGDVNALRVNSKGYLFLASQSGGIYRSTNDGGEWQLLSGGLPTGRVTNIAIDPLGTIVITHERGIYRSVDDGDHWELLSNRLTNCDKIALNSNQELFVTQNGNFYRSTNGGVTWTYEAPIGYVLSMTVTPSGYVFVGTNMQGVYRTALPTATPPVTDQFLSNYPNPFNSSTTLRFDLSNQSFVNLSIVNLLGQKIETIVDDVIPAGRYVYLWNARNLSSGIYVARIVTPGNVSSRKLMLLK
jgi:photosystem II stability/assembly factor-like uncharacterized protein